MATEDVASILVRFDNGARGTVAVSQISPGRKNSLQWEVDGSAGAAAWDSETPDHLWLGHRDRPNEILLRNPALMLPAGQAAAALPGGHVEGFADTFAALFRAIYADVLAGRPSERPPYATFADGPRRDARQRRGRRQRRGGALDGGRSGGRAARPGRRGGNLMRLGFLTAPFPDTPLPDVADWAAGAGFEVLEIACWPKATGPTSPLRRHQPHRRRQPVRRAGAGHPGGGRRPRAWRSPASASTRTRSTRIRRTANRSSATSSS